MAGTAQVSVLHEGYVREEDDADRVGSTVTLIRDGGRVIVVDPGMVSGRRALLGALAAEGTGPDGVTDVVFSHHHPDHTINMGLFPNAEVVDFWARYGGDQSLDHEGDGYALSPHCRLILTPGHTTEDATLLIETEAGTVACTHAWWRADRTPEIDPLADDQDALEASRERILELADLVVPAHGPAFEVPRRHAG